MCWVSKQRVLKALINNLSTAPTMLETTPMSTALTEIMANKI